MPKCSSSRYLSTLRHITYSMSPFFSCVNPSPRATVQRFFDCLLPPKIKKQESAFPVCKNFGEGVGGWRFSPDEAYNIGAKACVKMVNSGLGVPCLEIWFQNRSAAPVSRSLPHRTRRTGEGDQFIIRRERRSQGKIKGRCAAPAVSGSQRPIHPALIVTPGNRNSDRLFSC